jgi:hypothetical protein
VRVVDVSGDPAACARWLAAGAAGVVVDPERVEVAGVLAALH